MRSPGSNQGASGANWNNVMTTNNAVIAKSMSTGRPSAGTCCRLTRLKEKFATKSTATAVPTNSFPFSLSAFRQPASNRIRTTTWADVGRRLELPWVERDLMSAGTLTGASVLRPCRTGAQPSPSANICNRGSLWASGRRVLTVRGQDAPSRSFECARKPTAGRSRQQNELHQQHSLHEQQEQQQRTAAAQVPQAIDPLSR